MGTSCTKSSTELTTDQIGLINKHDPDNGQYLSPSTEDIPLTASTNVLNLIQNGCSFTRWQGDRKSASFSTIYLWHEYDQKHKLGTLYWNDSNQLPRIKQIGCEIPMKQIHDVFLGKQTDTFKSPETLELNSYLCFSLETPNTLISLHLQASSQDERNAWLAQFRSIFNIGHKHTNNVPHNYQHNGQPASVLSNNSQTRKYANGNQYMGQMFNNLPQGQGKMTYNFDNRTMEGTWTRGQAIGIFRIKYTNDDQYMGNVHQETHLPHGQGQFNYVGGEYYEGQWVNGMKTGQGILNINNKIYKGQFVDGLLHGRGRCQYLDGSVYEGEWNHGKRVGIGQLKDSQGNINYQGEWIDDNHTENT